MEFILTGTIGVSKVIGIKFPVTINVISIYQDLNTTI